MKIFIVLIISLIIGYFVTLFLQSRLFISDGMWFYLIYMKIFMVISLIIFYSIYVKQKYLDK